ncbi:MAG: hypothetical protein JWN04_4152 [Myxococcaceae bacterium]|nr:hypothetical protein [Myxococcaceae bacterium]
MHRRLSTVCSAISAAVLIVLIGSSEVSAQAAPAPTSHRKGTGSATRPDTASAAAASANAPPVNEKAARDAFERGRVFYDAGAFDQASSSFEEAYRLSGRDQLLYNIYLSYRDANQPAKAAEALRGYLAKVPNVDNRAQLESRLAALDQGLQREREQRDAQARAQAAPQPLPAAAVVPVPVAAPVARAHEPRSARFWAGVSLVSVGGALMLTSIATGVMAHNDASKLKDHCTGKVCDDSLKSTADSGRTLAHTTDGLLFGGLALAAGGTALLFLFGGLERDASAPPPVTALCSSHGCVAATTLRF